MTERGTVNGKIRQNNRRSTKMSNPDNNIRNVITRDTMCVIEKTDTGSLRTVYYPIAFDVQTMNDLRKLSTEMKSQEKELADKLLDELEEVGIKFQNDSNCPVNRSVDAAILKFNNAVQSVRQLAEINSEAAPSLGFVHGQWLYATEIYRLSMHANTIRGFDASHAEIEACQDKLENSDYEELEGSFNTATTMQPILLSALDRYETLFSDYIQKTEQIHPCLFSPRCYCQNLTAAYGNADLDYVMTPGNQCTVERIEEYYWACVLERLYDTYEANEKIIAYSHRKRGFFKYEIILDSGCDLRLLHETNFGFGRSVYLRSTLSYKGVAAINVSSLIFFRIAGKVSFSNCTFDYEVDEKNFASSFDEAVKLYSEYRTLGEANFVDKHFRKSLKDLSELLFIIANNDTFLEVTTLERLNSLTSGARNVLLPDEGFRDIQFYLSASEEQAAEEFAAAISNDVLSENFETSDKARELTKSLLSNLGENEQGRMNSKVDALQSIVKKDLLRNRVINEIISLLSIGGDDISSARVTSIIEKLIPGKKGIHAKKYKGYNLIEMRTEKALTAIRPIARLREIAELTNSEPAIKYIADACHHIGRQAKDYVSGTIEPNLTRVQFERDRAKDQLEKTEKQLEMFRQKKVDVSWLENQKRELKDEFLALDKKVAILNNQRSTLQNYIRAAQSIQE